MDFLLLDESIRNWVLFPIIIVMFVTSIARHHISELLQATPKSDLTATQNRNLLLRYAALRGNCGVLAPGAFEARRSTLTGDDSPLVALSKAPENPLATNPAADPSQMMDMMKNNIAMIVPQIALMSWVSFFFSGFILVKFPFPLTLRFKLMLQQGIELDSLDASYVSSLSWYFLNVFGLRGLLYIILGEGSGADDTVLMKRQMGAGPQTPEMHKMFAAEKDNLALTNHLFAGTAADQRLLQRIVNEN